MVVMVVEEPPEEVMMMVVVEAAMEEVVVMVVVIILRLFHLRLVAPFDEEGVRCLELRAGVRDGRQQTGEAVGLQRRLREGRGRLRHAERGNGGQRADEASEFLVQDLISMLGRHRQADWDGNGLARVPLPTS